MCVYIYMYIYIHMRTHRSILVDLKHMVSKEGRVLEQQHQLIYPRMTAAVLLAIRQAKTMKILLFHLFYIVHLVLLQCAFGIS